MEYTNQCVAPTIRSSITPRYFTIPRAITSTLLNLTIDRNHKRTQHILTTELLKIVYAQFKHYLRLYTTLIQYLYTIFNHSPTSTITPTLCHFLLPHHPYPYPHLHIFHTHIISHDNHANDNNTNTNSNTSPNNNQPNTNNNNNHINIDNSKFKGKKKYIYISIHQHKGK